MREPVEPVRDRLGDGEVRIDGTARQEAGGEWCDRRQEVFHRDFRDEAGRVEGTAGVLSGQDVVATTA